MAPKPTRILDVGLDIPVAETRPGQPSVVLQYLRGLLANPRLLGRLLGTLVAWLVAAGLSYLLLDRVSTDVAATMAAFYRLVPSVIRSPIESVLAAIGAPVAAVLGGLVALLEAVVPVLVVSFVALVGCLLWLLLTMREPVRELPLDYLYVDELDQSRAVDHLVGENFGAPRGTSSGEIVLGHIADGVDGLRSLPAACARRRQSEQIHPILIGVPAGSEPTVTETLRAYELGLVVDADQTAHLQAALQLFPYAWEELDRQTLSGYGSVSVQQVDVSDIDPGDDVRLAADLTGMSGEPLHEEVDYQGSPSVAIVGCPAAYVDQVQNVFGQADVPVAVVTHDEPAVTVVRLYLDETFSWEGPGPGASIGDDPTALPAADETPDEPTPAGAATGPRRGVGRGLSLVRGAESATPGPLVGQQNAGLDSAQLDQPGHEQSVLDDEDDSRGDSNG